MRTRTLKDFNTDTVTSDSKEALEETKEKVKDLLEKVEKVEKATNTANTEKVEDITSENLNMKDKTHLEGAKDDFESAIEDHNQNMTEEEKEEHYKVNLYKNFKWTILIYIIIVHFL